MSENLKQIAREEAEKVLATARNAASNLVVSNTKEEPYRNREIKEMFKDVQESLTRIESQVIKTNGRVSVLERWQSYVLGFYAAVVLLLLPIVFNLIK